MSRNRPSVHAWGRGFTAIGVGAGAWLTALTTLESDLFHTLAVWPAGVRLAVSGAVSIASAVAVWILAARRDSQTGDRQSAFAEVIAAGNRLIDRCRLGVPEGSTKPDVLADLVGAWESWDRSGFDVVKRWGTAADVETYSRENPYDLSDRSKVAGNVTERLDRIERIMRA